MTEHDKEDQVAKYRLKLEETADLVARIRHEINNPLTGVLGQAQLLLRARDFLGCAVDRGTRARWCRVDLLRERAQKT